jgi:peroxiredoxin
MPIASLLLLVAPLEGGRMKRECPDLTFGLPNGEKVDLRAHRGKVVALEVMLTTCSHCKECAHALQKIYEDLGPQGFQPLAVSINDNSENLVAGYAREQQLTFPVGFGDHAKVLEFVRHQRGKPLFTPVLIFIDRKGLIRAQYTGSDYFFRHGERNIRELVEELLAEE